MRPLVKEAQPQVLTDNGANWLVEWLADRDNSTKRYRYRHSEIKNALMAETFGKCVYCESFIGVVHPGETEHIVPSSRVPERHFDWENLTRACTECNRRKNDFYSENDGFVNPYADPVDRMFEHHGPVVFHSVGDVRAEIAIRVLAFNDRSPLVLAKVSALLALQDALSRYASEQNDTLKELMRLELLRRAETSGQYSAMIRQVLTLKRLI